MDWNAWALGIRNSKEFQGSSYKKDHPVTVVLSCKNKEDVLPIVVAALGRQIRKPDFLFLLDDHSTDNSKAVFEEACRKANLLGRAVDVRGQGPFLLNSARNQGFEVAPEGLVISLDGDLKVGPGFIAAHQKIHLNSEFPCLSNGPRLESANPEGSGPVNYMWGHEVWANVSRHPGEAIPYWSTLMGGNLGMTKSLWRSLQGFDEAYNGGYGIDDQDFFYRTHLVGIKAFGDFEAYVIHLPHPPDPSVSRESARNCKIFSQKYGFEIYQKKGFGAIPPSIAKLGWAFGPWSNIVKLLDLGRPTALMTHQAFETSKDMQSLYNDPVGRALYFLFKGIYAVKPLYWLLKNSFLISWNLLLWIRGKNKISPKSNEIL